MFELARMLSWSLDMRDVWIMFVWSILHGHGKVKKCCCGRVWNAKKDCKLSVNEFAVFATTLDILNVCGPDANGGVISTLAPMSILSSAMVLARANCFSLTLSFLQ